MIIWVVLAIAAGIALWLAGFWAGSILTRALRETVIHEVPKVVETQVVVEHEKPVIIQVPTPAPARPGNAGPSLAVMNGANRNVIANPVEREQMDRIRALSDLPEA